MVIEVFVQYYPHAEFCTMLQSEEASGALSGPCPLCLSTPKGSCVFDQYKGMARAGQPSKSISIKVMYSINVIDSILKL